MKGGGGGSEGTCELGGEGQGAKKEERLRLYFLSIRKRVLALLRRGLNGERVLGELSKKTQREESTKRSLEVSKNRGGN